MRKIITVFAITISLTASAQKSDSTTKKDTVGVPVYIIEKTDTVKVETLLYKGNKNTVMFSSPGYYIYKQKMATTDGKNYKPFSDPVIIGAMDDKKRQVVPLDN